jgi:hypothetical protein
MAMPVMPGPLTLFHNGARKRVTQERQLVRKEVNRRGGVYDSRAESRHYSITIIRVIKHWREVGGNAVVFDIKDSDGTVTIAFEHPLLGRHNVYVHDVPKFVHFLHQQNMHAVARIAIFRDERLVVNHPELAVQSRKNRTTWRENGKLVWTDPSNPQVQDYDVALAKHVAQLGVDEIQFDYVRFPAEGDQKDAAFVFQKDQPETAQAPDASGDNNSCDDGRLARPRRQSRERKTS